MKNFERIPVFSIITVCLNDCAGLMRTRASILAQSWTDYEWIVIDGASVDGTRGVLEQLPINECRWISEKDQGLYDAMNKGMQKTKGNFLLFLNSGDELASADVLASVAAAIDVNNPPQFVYGDSYEETQDGAFILKRAYTHKMVWYGMFAHHQAMFFSRTCLPDAYSTAMRYASDYGFVAACLKHADSVIKVPFPICKFESGGISQTGSTDVANREQWIVRRTILGYSEFTCALIHGLHVLILRLRKRLPVIYRLARFGYAKNKI